MWAHANLQPQRCDYLTGTIFEVFSDETNFLFLKFCFFAGTAFAVGGQLSGALSSQSGCCKGREHSEIEEVYMTG